MGLQTEFLPLSVDALPAFAADRKREGWRFVQLLAVRTDAGCDLVYSFMKDGLLENHVVEGVTKETPVPSITDQFLAAFVFENEAHDLFGIDIRDIAIDFGGKFYQLAQSEPMTIISPAQKAARDKAAKAAAAKAAKERPAQGEAAGGAEDLEAKLSGMDPEKAAKVRAAMEAKAKKEAAAKQAAVDEKVAALDPEKAAKVKAALAAKAAREKAKQEQDGAPEGADGAGAAAQPADADGAVSPAQDAPAAAEGEGE